MSKGLMIFFAVFYGRYWKTFLFLRTSLASLVYNKFFLARYDVLFYSFFTEYNGIFPKLYYVPLLKICLMIRTPLALLVLMYCFRLLGMTQFCISYIESNVFFAVFYAPYWKFLSLIKTWITSLGRIHFFSLALWRNVLFFMQCSFCNFLWLLQYFCEILKVCFLINYEHHSLRSIFRKYTCFARSLWRNTLL